MKNDMTDINQIAITSPDGRQERLEQLRELFPDLFDGEGQLDEKSLRTLVSNEAGVAVERFSFDWAGKQKSKRFAFTPSKATLQFDAERSVNKDGSSNKAGEDLEDNTSKNLIIEGDNLEVLKLLQATYFEQVKCIYIDPPYNTGKDFIYPDDYSQTRKDYWEANGTTKDGIHLKAIKESSGRRHSEWLNFMQSRLLLARRLLRVDGVIFISIDDNEIHNLRKLCDDVFGESNFISCIMWKRKKEISSDSLNVSVQGEYILIYRKSIESKLKLESLSKDYIKKSYKIPTREFPDGKWRPVPITVSKGLSGGGYEYEIETPSGVKHARLWAYPKKGYDRLLAEGRVFFGKDKDGIPQRVIYAHESNGQPTTNYWDSVATNKQGKNEIISLFGDSFFDTPKPTGLIKKIISLTMDKQDIALDFFAGSGTTAHALMDKNLEDDGNRKHILVQIPELTSEKSEAYKAGYKTISNITIERIKRAGANIQDNNPATKVDTGFRVFKLTDSSFPENLFSPDPAKSEEENLKALKAHLAEAAQMRLFSEDKFSNLVTEISLKNGFGLFYELEPVGELSKNKVYRLIGNDKSALLCLDNDLHDETVEGLKPFKDEQLIVSKSALDTTKKFSLQTEFKDNLWVV